ncbi:MAG: hypothetical protein R3E39_17515 [Anaerolineae bacterium]
MLYGSHGCVSFTPIHLVRAAHRFVADLAPWDIQIEVRTTTIMI